MSKFGAGGMSLVTVGTGIALILCFTGTFSWLNFLYLLSYIKLTLTVIKYIPQVYMNYLRKSTTGWSIINVLLDFSGGVFSILQILIDSWVMGSWSGITGFLIKLALGVVTLIFDTIFILQHYVWFPQTRGPHIVDVDGEMEMKEADLKTSIPPHSPFSEDLKRMEENATSVEPKKID